MPENYNNIGKWLATRPPALPLQPAPTPANHDEALKAGAGTASVLPSVSTDETDAAVALTGNDAATITVHMETTCETGAGALNLTCW